MSVIKNVHPLHSCANSGMKSGGMLAQLNLVFNFTPRGLSLDHNVQFWVTCCRGVVLEAQGRFDEAVKDYRTVLAAEPNDPSAWNNLGNASAGLQKWDDAAEYYGKASSLAPAFSFAAANKALATYQLGEQDPKNTDEALREMR